MRARNGPATHRSDMGMHVARAHATRSHALAAFDRLPMADVTLGLLLAVAIALVMAVLIRVTLGDAPSYGPPPWPREVYSALDTRSVVAGER